VTDVLVRARAVEISRFGGQIDGATNGQVGKNNSEMNVSRMRRAMRSRS
jgi:hypothetical protein